MLDIPLFLVSRTSYVITWATSKLNPSARPPSKRHNKTGKETAEDNTDQLLLSVTYFCQEHRKPLCQYRVTDIVVFNGLEIITNRHYPVFNPRMMVWPSKISLNYCRPNTSVCWRPRPYGPGSWITLLFLNVMIKFSNVLLRPLHKSEVQQLESFDSVGYEISSPNLFKGR